MALGLAELTTQAHRLIAAGDLAGARTLLGDALTSTHPDPAHASPDLIEAAGLLARVLIAIDDPQAARGWAAFTYAAARRRYGPGNERTIFEAATLAAVLHRVGSRARSARVYQDVIVELTAIEGPESLRVLAAHADLATVEFARGDCAVARGRLEDAWELHREVYGDGHVAGIKMLARLGAMERDCGRLTQAHDHLALALELCRQNLPADDPLTAQVTALAAAPPDPDHHCEGAPAVVAAGPSPVAPGDPADTPPQDPPGVPVPPGIPVPPRGPVPPAPRLPMEDGLLGGTFNGPDRFIRSTTAWQDESGWPDEPGRAEDRNGQPEAAGRAVLPEPERHADPPSRSDWSNQRRWDEPTGWEGNPMDESPGPGPSRPESPRPDPPLSEPPRPEPTRPGPSRPEPSRPAPSRPEQLWLDEAWPDEGWQDEAWPWPVPPSDTDGPHDVEERLTGSAGDPAPGLYVPPRDRDRSRQALPLLVGGLVIVALSAAAIIAGFAMDDSSGPAATSGGATGGTAMPGATATPTASSTGSGTPTAAPASPPPPAKPGTPPGGVSLRDSRDSVMLAWTYPAGAEGPVVVSGGRSGQQPRAFQELPAGTTSYVVYGLNQNTDYCFTVAVVYSTDTVGRTAPVCTRRSGRSLLR